VHVELVLDLLDDEQSRWALNILQRLIGTSLRMGATLSKLWASLRSALSGSAPAGNHTQQQNTTAAAKDIESGTYTPAKTISATMPEVKKYEITEVR
jgi:hypothetical protein